REMMSEDNPLVGLDEVLSIIMHFARSSTSIIELQHAASNPLGIKAKSDRIRAQRRQQKISRTDLLASAQSQNGVSARAQQGHPAPKEVPQQVFHLRTRLPACGRSSKKAVLRLIRLRPQPISFPVHAP